MDREALIPLQALTGRCGSDDDHRPSGMRDQGVSGRPEDQTRQSPPPAATDDDQLWLLCCSFRVTEQTLSRSALMHHMSAYHVRELLDPRRAPVGEQGVLFTAAGQARNGRGRPESWCPSPSQPSRATTSAPRTAASSKANPSAASDGLRAIDTHQNRSIGAVRSFRHHSNG